MSFGFSVGDFIAVIELANKARKEFVSAPSQFKDISDEVKSLSNVLRDIDDLLPERELTSQQQTELYDIAKGCRNVLKNLNETLEKYHELDSNPTTFGRKARRVWKKLKWEPEDIRELRSRIIANITLLNAFQGKLASRISLATKDGVDRLHQRHDDRERRLEYQAVIDWLTPIDYAPQQSDYISRRQDGTGQWLLKSNEFKKWVNQSNQTLFCPGIPGAGKTIITSIVVDDLYTKFQNDASVGLAYIYCNFRRQQEQKPDDLLASLLKQLVQEQPFMPENVKSLHERHKDKRTRASLDEISKALHSIVAAYSRVFIIIDALDECQGSDGGRKRFLAELFGLQARTGASLLITSRFIPEIVKEFEERSVQLEIRASDDDLQRYLDGHMSKLPSFVSRNADLQNEVKIAIINAVDGMFLLAQLHLDSLVGKRSPKAIKVGLEKLPKGSEAYDHGYKEAMERIGGQVPDSQELAKQVLAWITCAKRPLTTSELQHALAVEYGESELDKENLPEIEDMVSVCAGLVTVDEESDIIRLVHYTTQEYFERTQKDWFPNAEKEIAMICVTYLLYDAFETGFCLTDEEFETRLQLNPFYGYAARNWGHHACAASTITEELFLDFLKNEAKVSACSQAMMASRGYPGYSQRVPGLMSGVHLAACFGLKALVASLRNLYNLDSKDTYGQTPLWWAAKNGHVAVIELLLARRDVDPNSKDAYGQTPLLLAAENGHEAAVKLLLLKDGVELNSTDSYGWTPLWCAAGNGHEAVIQLLLAKAGVDPDFKDNNDRTPLSRAAEKGQEAVAKLLLAADCVNPDSKDKSGRTPLLWAAENGREAVIKLLLAKDVVDPDSKDTEHGRTPLSFAAENGHEAVVKLLLARDGVDPNSEDDVYRRTPLWWAAFFGHEAVVKLLLPTDGINPDSKDNLGQTPLSRAAENGHEAVVKLLLAMDSVNPDSTDTYGWTPLWCAAGNGHKAVVQLLLAEIGVDPDFKDVEYGRTPLSWAAANGHEAVVKLLLAHDGVDPDSRDDDNGRTPLSYVAAKGHEAVVKLLLAKTGVDPDSKDRYGRTPLSWAAGHGHEAVVRLLLAKAGVDPDSKDTKHGRTPLSWAAGSRCEAVVKLLLAQDGVDPGSKDRYGRTPLSWAAGYGHEVVVKLLLAQNGVDPGSKDRYGRTPLLEAAEYGHEAVVKLLSS